MTNDTPTASPAPTGVIADGPLGQELQLTRRYRVPIDAVWAAMTESERLERWIGRWEGDPRTGRVDFYMTAEGDDVAAEEYRIEVCEPPHRFAGTTSVGDDRWRLRFELSEADGVTTLVFAQAVVDDLGNVGPGWEYYLDRLEVALGEGDAATVAWDAYFPAMRTYYDGLAR
ncbi:SRPBCC family protein [Agromyces subbeticus]|uniref:SRPBCC family protein n=1 Tax=Agromyces subbeticus TaxID=293890 RepID=UPI0003B71D59|nr:SRPBCC family protein [Agromyces subbeticus]